MGYQRRLLGLRHHDLVSCVARKRLCLVRDIDVVVIRSPCAVPGLAPPGQSRKIWAQRVRSALALVVSTVFALMLVNRAAGSCGSNSRPLVFGNGDC